MAWELLGIDVLLEIWFRVDVQAGREVFVRPLPLEATARD